MRDGTKMRIARLASFSVSASILALVVAASAGACKKSAPLTQIGRAHV